MRKFIAAIGMGVLLGALGLVAVPAGAGLLVTTECTGNLAPGSYDKVVVPRGAVCTTEGPVTIKYGVTVNQGATLVFGSEQSSPGVATIHGGVYADRAASVQIHFSTIYGSLSILGGSGPYGPPFDVTWIAIEDNTIVGSVYVNGYNGYWFGFIRNTVNSSVALTNNRVVDPDGNEYVTNTISGSLWCAGNSPAPQIGDSGGSPNTVSGRKAGQCASL